MVVKRNRTPSKYVGYGLYLYFLGLSYRNTSKALSRFVKRSHVSIWKWIQKYRPTQVIQNLLDNAVKFTERGSITVNIEHNREDMTNVRVKDTGHGIDANILNRLFSKFVSKSFQGIGLGLFISKGIIEAHGGKISADNNSNGIGATFSFSLPS